MEKEFFISAAIVTYNDGEKAANACRSIIENTKKYPLKLYVIDNASSDGTADMLATIKGVNLIRNKENIGFGAAHNMVLKEEMGEIHFIINPDIVFSGDVLSELVDFHIENPDIVLSMPKIQNPDGSEQKLPKEVPSFKRLFLGRLAPLGGIFRKIRDEYTWSDRDITEVTDIDFCSGCFSCVRSDIFKKLDGYDQRFFMYLEDADLTVRAKKYGRVVINPHVAVTHLWERESAKSLKYLLIHTLSCFKFLFKKRR